MNFHYSLTLKLLKKPQVSMISVLLKKKSILSRNPTVTMETEMAAEELISSCPLPWSIANDIIVFPHRLTVHFYPTWLITYCVFLLLFFAVRHCIVHSLIKAFQIFFKNQTVLQYLGFWKKTNKLWFRLVFSECLNLISHHLHVWLHCNSCLL